MHYGELIKYTDLNNDRMQSFYARRPLMVGLQQKLDNEFEKVNEQLKSIDEEDFRKYELRKSLTQVRDQRTRIYQELQLKDQLADIMDGVTSYVDVLAQLLDYGRGFAENIGTKYNLMAEALEKLSKSLYLSREMFGESGVLYACVRTLDKGFEQVKGAEKGLENPRLIAKAYQHIPDLPPNKGLVSILDHVNVQFSSGRARYRIRGA
jgi:hypothetical protein